MRRLRITDDHPWLRYVLAIAVGLLLALTVCFARDIFHETDVALIVRYLSDRVCVMFLGKICELGDTKEIYAEPQGRITVVGGE